ncbi:amino acid adenylation domain-containing protein [Algoriphagus sp. 4150]|uniref:non-ribosomal peptide synthetase n=1 Tax=Algoriphagus sp. 4150 TaxID=2817756 RepID=UPI0028663B32|nr:non-ribosomal peptide synthetase [Algoriphagus sp. 4150]MDR7132712.1 amino acid adenylation domain-containing protein [Algoriphagus sp. 4150]
MKNIHTFFNEMKLLGGAIWFDGSVLKVFLSKKFQTKERKDFIVTNEKEILLILKDNEVYSKEDFKRIRIFKDVSANFFFLSSAQERLWFIEQYEGGTNAYHIPSVFEVAKTTDVGGIRYAIQQVVSRHEALRSTLAKDDNHQGIQIVHNEPLVIEEAETGSEVFEMLLKEDINRPFDLSLSYPIRVKFYFVGPSTLSSSFEKIILLINIHHIACDGWSMDIFQRELLAYYEAYCNQDVGFNLPPITIQYKDYALWQRAYLTGEVLNSQLSYWKNKLVGYQSLELPTDYARPKTIDYSGAQQTFELSRETSIRLRTLARDYGVTLHSVLLTSVAVLLNKYTGQEDIVIGSPIANRHHRQTEGLIGFFVNMLVNRTQLSSNQSFKDLIQQVHAEQVLAQLNQDLPFEKLVDELGVERDTSRHPIFQVMFVVQNFGNDTKWNEYFMPFTGSLSLQVEKFDLSIFIDDDQEALSGRISYAASLFHSDTIARLIDHYCYLLDQLSCACEKPFSSISLLNLDEYNKLVNEWNETETDFPRDQTIHHLFEQKAEKSPYSVALIFENNAILYKELNEKSNQLARHIREQYQKRMGYEVKKDTLFVLYLERGPELIIGILGILKAGGAYVPIDTHFPQARIDYILEDTHAEFVLCQRLTYYKSRIPDHKALYIDGAEPFFKTADTSNLLLSHAATDLAYVIYTSGTTGKPKGVMIEHQAVLSLVCNDYIQISRNDVFAFLSSPVFDAATFEIWTPLLRGNTLVIPVGLNDLVSDIGSFSKFLKLHQITILWLTKTLFENLYYLDHTLFKSLNYLIIGGEALDKIIVTEFVKKKYTPLHFLNGYGPTESTTFTCTWDLSTPITTKNVPIGVPIKNRFVYVLSPDLTTMPIGVTGELFIGGAGLARGYLNDIELTEKHFITNPFTTRTNQAKDSRLYKTGDLVRWLSNGTLEYVGRNDDQIKISGYRVQLKEIENALMRIEGVIQSTVLMKERGTDAGIVKYLVAYYVLDRNISRKESDVLESWENLYNLEYEKNVRQENVYADFSGWNSYISGEPIPLSEMYAWRNNILSIIKKLAPGNVLEIGVGSGLLMYPLLEYVEKYTGLDLSQSIIERHQANFKQFNFNVEFYHLRADEIDQLDPDVLYDTIIMNSVSQYFPSIGYFENVITKAIEKLSSGGSIFLGDIRNYDLHRALIEERLDYRKQAWTPSMIDEIVSKENEFLVSPQYFLQLRDEFENLDIHVVEREEGYDNELSRYRYDVVISLKKNVSKGRPIRIDHSSGLLSKRESSNYCNIPYLNKLSEIEILDQLAEMLPDYMMPSALIALESMPLTINGKLDRDSLPELDFSVQPDGYIAPERDEEIGVCLIWQQVLGVDKVGLNDDFFKIGGNSILAIRLSHRMTGFLGYNVRVSDIFNYKCISQLLLQGIKHTLTGIAKTQSNQSVLSFAQERLWFIEQYEGGTNAYHIPSVFEVAKTTDVGGIRYAIQQVVSRHEALRSTLAKDDNHQGIQIVHNEPLVIEEAETGSEVFEMLLKEDINRPFDLSLSYPIRVKFYFVGPSTLSSSFEKIILLINIHHIACDGWSMDIFQRELLAYYEAYCNQDVGFNLPPITIQYKDYALWQRAYLTGEVLNSQLSYWKNKLVGYQSLELPTDYARPKTIDYSGAQQTFELSRETSIRLRTLARDYGVTLHSVLLTSVAVLLNKYTGQEDIVIGSPIANRHHRQTEGLIGFFVNMLVNRTQLSSNQSFKDLIQQVHAEQVLAQLNQDLPFEKLVDELGVERDTSRHPIFQVMFVVQNFGNARKEVDSSKKYITPLGEPPVYDVEKFDLSIFIDDDQEALSGRISYATSLFHSDTIGRLVHHYKFLLNQLAHIPEKAYSELGLLSDSERHHIIFEWNNTDRFYPKDKTIHQLFEEQVEKAPDRPALIFEEYVLTYHQLNVLSNRLAHFIRHQYKRKSNMEMPPGAPIGLFLDRSLEMIIGILGVLKAGGAYVPLDISFPQERIDYILDDSKAMLILSQRELLKDDRLKLLPEMVIDIDLGEAFYHEENEGNLSLTSSSTDLVYVLYTSGTTGRPKGVMLEHFSVCNRILHMIEYSEVNSDDFHLLKTNYVFDVSFGEIFTHLCVGARVQVTRHIFDISELNELLTNYKFTSIHLVPSQYDLLASTIDVIGLTKIYFSGEALTEKIVSSLTHRPIRIYNYYGPTELGEITVSTVTAPNMANVIGKVFPNSRAYILDVNKVPVPVGVVGELYVGGDGVARGYLNKDELTKERFVSNFFATDEDVLKGYTRLYKTGDMVRWLSDGNLQFVGRKDEQVKIRGYRIELGEIENALLQVPDIRKVCVLVKARQTTYGSIKYLVAYYVSDNTNVSYASIAEAMSFQLPNYMIPDYFVAMESLPLTVNGKLDKRLLPDPDYGSLQEFIAPATKIEKILCGIWQKELQLDKVGISDEFFRIGGNSIHTIVMIAKIKKMWNVEISVKELFLNTTVQMIAKLIHQKISSNTSTTESIGVGASLSLSSENLYDALKNQVWRYLNFTKGIHYSSNSMIKKDLQNVNQRAMSEAINSLVERHESLRTLFVDRAGRVFQKICASDLLKPHLVFVDMSDLKEKEIELKLLIESTYNHLFDFENEPSFKSTLVKFDENNYILIFVIDHIIHDAHSLNLIADELFILYEAYCSQYSNPLPALKLQLRDYALFEKQHYKNPKLAFHESFFDSLFSNPPRKPEICVVKTQKVNGDFTKARHDGVKGGGYRFAVSEELLMGIQKISSDCKISVFNFMLAAYCTFLSRVSDQNDFIVDTPMSTRINQDFSKIIGWLTGTLVSRIKIEKTKSFGELLLLCQKQIVDSTDHIYYQEYGKHLKTDWDQIATQLNLVLDNSSFESRHLALGHHSMGKLYFDIAFVMVVFNDGILIDCNYKYEAIDPSAIEAVCGKFIDVLDEVIYLGKQ